MAVSNLERYRADLKALDDRAVRLGLSIQRLIDAPRFDARVRKQLGDEEGEKTIKALPNFREEYQSWYSEASAVIRQLLPDRLEDFRAHYLRPKVARKHITAASYVIEDLIHGIRVSMGGQTLVDESAAVPRFEAQAAILKACAARFESTLFDIRQLVQADVFDDELAAARELLRNKFNRAAGAIAGVVLEHHLQQVLENHSIKLSKKNPSLGDLSQALKDADVVDTAGWRRLQHLGDLRNKCDHKKAADPTPEEVQDLIDGVDRTIKNLF